MNEIASGVRSALKSWLAFGASITGNKPKSIASVRMSQSSESGQPQFPQSRMKAMFRPSSTEGKIQQTKMLYTCQRFGDFFFG